MAAVRQYVCLCSEGYLNKRMLSYWLLSKKKHEAAQMQHVRIITRTYMHTALRMCALVCTRAHIITYGHEYGCAYVYGRAHACGHPCMHMRVQWAAVLCFVDVMTRSMLSRLH